MSLSEKEAEEERQAKAAVEQEVTEMPAVKELIDKYGAEIEEIRLMQKMN